MKAEFKVGDTVTFNPYGEAYKREVVSISIGAPFVAEDDRIFYHLGTRYPGLAPRTLTVTTGLCVEESILFNLEGESA